MPAVIDAPPAQAGPIDLGAIEDAALAQADRLTPRTWEVDALALTLAFDLSAIHAFVHDHIAFDSYPGVLGGAQGTLSARAGNAWDRALLLHELVDASGYDVGFAFGTLGDDAIAALLASAPAGARDPLDDPPLADVLPVDLGRIADRARRDHALLLDALDGRLPGGAEADRPAHVRARVWLQARDDDGAWRDLDPAAPFGEALAVPDATADALPDDVHHVVVVRVVVETLESGDLTEAEVLEEHFVAADAAGQELWRYVQPDREGIGGAIVGVLEGAAWLPVLLVDGEARRGTAFEIAGGAGGQFGSLFGSAGANLVALHLELETRGPGMTPSATRRVLYDRASAALRSSGAIAADALEPLPDDGSPVASGGLHHVLVSTGGASPREHAIARAFAANSAANELRGEDAATSYGLADLLLPLAVADQALVVASERAIVDGLAADGNRAFVTRPRVYLASLLPFPDVPDGTARLIDLALDGVDVAVAADAPADTASRYRFWYGVLQTALETEAALRATRAVDPETATVDSVSLAMAGATLRVVGPEHAATAEAQALRDALADGALAVLVGDEMRFWVVDPASGATRSVFEPGIHPGFTWGGNYTNAVGGGDAYAVTPDGKRSRLIRNGRSYNFGRPPPSRCSGGNEYVVLLGCVSIPAGMTVGMANGVVVTAAVAWAIVALQLWFG